jgi:tetratricopeptide (TPR) repeat protein/tRNA A-37 threonylcarbamoyl transferase component Bud32
MNPNIDILRAELERLFSLDEMTAMSKSLLGLDPEDVGGATAKASFAKALTDRCLDGDRLDALVDCIVVARQGVDPRVRDVSGLLGKEEVAQGKTLGAFLVLRKLGESEFSIVYVAKRGDEDRVLKVLRREACRDKRAVQRFLTANRMVASVDHPGIPTGIEAGEADDQFWISYVHVDAQPLSARFARTGPSHINEIKPTLRAILEPLAALHKARIAHGDLKLENVLIGRVPGSAEPRVTLIDFGTDRLRQRPTAANGHTGVLAVFGSPKTIAPEQVRGRNADAATDVYAFGAMMYELLSGKPVFQFETATDGAFAHLSKAPEPPSVKAPRGWIAKDVDQFVLSLLAKEADKRPKDAAAVIDALESLGRASTTLRAGQAAFPEEKLTNLVDLLIAAPDDADAAMSLEKAIDEGADPLKVAEAFDIAADGVEGEGPENTETKKALLFRAARIFDTAIKDKERAEKVYVEITVLDPKDEIAMIALDEVRKALGKHGEIVESLLARSEGAAPGEERARIYAEIGRVCASELQDPEQGILAYTRALCETPTVREYADEIERHAEGKAQLWNEVLGTITEGTKHESLSGAERNKLLAYAGRWYEQKLARADLGLMAFQQILTTDPANEEANEGLAVIYRKAQQWPELVAILVARAGVAGSSPRGRDMRTEAAELFEQKLNDAPRAKEVYAQVLAEDPGHIKAGDGMARIAERTGDFKSLVAILERRAEARRGREKADSLLKVAEVYEDHLEDLGEATRRYEAVLAIEPHDLVALKGLDRIYNRSGKYRELLENLERQIAIAATPRQKINIYERMAALHDEEFLDHQKAADCLEQILAIDPANDAALTKLPRHYRALGRWEQLDKLYEKHGNVTADEARRVELTMQRARVLAENIGSPERATRVYEQVLEMHPGHAGALEALARLRELSGDSHAALSAIEALAGKGTTPEARAEQWTRAARLLDGRGDRDGAIERYKLAIEANPKDASAAAALRQAYASRGDSASVVAIIEKELLHAEGRMAKARLHADLARVFRDRMKDNEKAETNAKTAIELDATNAEASLVLGDLAFEGERYIEATKYLEPLVGRAAVLPKEDATRVLVRFVEAFGKTVASRTAPPPPVSSREGRESQPRISQPRIKLTETHPRLAAAVQALEQAAGDDADALSRVAKVMFDCGDAETARETYEKLLKDHGAKMSHTDRAEALWRLGESTRRAGNLGEAVKVLRDASDADPANPGPLQALAKVYEEWGDWEEVIRVKRRRLEVATGNERFDLLLEIGDVEFGKLSDRGRASKTYVAALEERPDDRKLLTKLMQLYSEEKDWAKLVEVVLRLADFVEDPKQRAKYMHTAAIVSSRQLGEIEQALTFYERALEFDPALTRAMEEAIELRREKSDHDGVERLLKMQLEHAKQTQDRAKIVVVLDQLGELYRKLLNEPELAIDAYEAAQAFDPEGKERAEILAELYASDVTQYLEKAVKAQGGILRRNPYRAESYKLLRKLYTEARRPDPAWCLCQALCVLNLAEPDEERFYRRHRADNAAPAQAVLNEEDWNLRITHAEADPLVTRIFALIQPTIIRARTQPLEALGYDPRYRIDLTLHPYPVSQTLYYVQGVFGFEAPPVFQNPNDPTGLGFLHAHTPALVLGRAAFESVVPNQSLAFVAGRHITYYRPGFYVRHLVPTGTGLKAWLFAAIKLCVPQFPVAPDLQGQVDEAMKSMGQDFQGVQREHLASTVSKLLQSGGAIDLKKWVAAIDMTADRAGFILAHDLSVATEVMRATEDAASVASKERIKEAVLYSVSEEYLALREKLQVTIE